MVAAAGAGNSARNRFSRGERASGERAIDGEYQIHGLRWSQGYDLKSCYTGSRVRKYLSNLVIAQNYLLKHAMHRSSTPGLGPACVCRHLSRSSDVVEKNHPAAQLGSIARPSLNGTEGKPIAVEGCPPHTVMPIG